MGFNGASGHISTIGELAEYLTHYPPDTPIVIAKDSEGDSFSPLWDANVQMYQAESNYSGQTYLTPEDLAEEMNKPDTRYTTKDSAPLDSIRVITLWPTN